MKFGGGNTFNAGTAMQPLDASYTILKECGKENELEEVYLELFFAVASRPEYQEREGSDMTRVYTVSDYLKPSMNKYQYLLHASGAKYYVNSFLMARRNISDLQLNTIIGNIKNKTTESYKNYEYLVKENYWYEEKGFIGSDITIDKGIFYSQTNAEIVEDNIFNKDYIESLFQIIEYCEENDIKLTLYSAPMSDFYLANVDYDNYIRQVEILLEDTTVPYVDFNLCKESTLLLDCELDYRESNHLNSNGAYKFSKVFGETFADPDEINAMILRDDISNIYLPEEAFYSSYQEKFSHLDDSLLGVIITTEGDEYTIESVISGNVKVQYEIILENTVLIEMENEFTTATNEVKIEVVDDVYQIPLEYEGKIKLGITINDEDIGYILIEK
ncbi:MAG: hypothetical protein R3Y24_15785 [Eubacteriales bacterium]